MRSQVLPWALESTWSLWYSVQEETILTGPWGSFCQICQMRLDTIYRFEEKSVCQIQATLALVKHQ